MPQELQVLRCYSCRFFQVHIVKKSRKWECKMCGEKQSMKKVYGRGSGQECRAHVQKLNILASLQQENQITAYGSGEHTSQNYVHYARLNPSVSSSSKWSVFLDKSENEDNEEGNLDTFSEFHKQNDEHSLKSCVESMRNEVIMCNAELTTFRNGNCYQTQDAHLNQGLNLSTDPDSVYKNMQEDSPPKSSENNWLKYMHKARKRSNRQLLDHNVNSEGDKETVCDESVVFRRSSNWDMYLEKPAYEAGSSKLVETSVQLMDNNSDDSVETCFAGTERQIFPNKVTTARESSAFHRDYNEDELNSILDI